MKIDNKIKIAIVGCGAIVESFYLPALKRHPDIMKHLVLVDENEGRTSLLASQYMLKEKASHYTEIIKSVDAAILAVPPNAHYPIGIDFLNNGKHLLCEKPLTESLSHVDAMVQAASEKKAVLCVNNTRRLFPSYTKAKEIIQSGKIGDIKTIEYFEGGEFNWPTTSGFYFRNGGDPKGVLSDRGAHVMDLICWWLGEKPELVASQNDSFGGPEAVAEVQFKCRDCTGTVKLSWLGKLKNAYRIEGAKGSIGGDIYDFNNLEVRYKNENLKKITGPNKIGAYVNLGNRLVDNFIDTIQGKAEPLVSGSVVRDSIWWIEECYQKATRFNLPWYETAGTIND